MRKKIVAGNWKMNKTPNETREFLKILKDLVANSETEVVVCVPFLSIPIAVLETKGTNIKIGAQNLHWEEKGAYTGEISAQMLKDSDVEYVIIGHSERRQYFNETDENVNKKIHAALKMGLKPIVCVGESLTQREQGITEELVGFQTKIAMLGLTANQLEDIIIAYEPIWAIGTGKTATCEQADEVCKIIRNCIGNLYGNVVSEKVRIQYGGSVTADNAKELFNMPNIDGALVGGASLKSSDFERIVKFNK